MNVYQTDDLGFFVGVEQARESPLEPGVFLIPRNAYTDAPPTIPEGRVARRDGGEWVLEDIPVEGEDVDPPWSELTDAQKRAKVDAERDARLLLPLTHTVRGTPYDFHTDETSLRRVTAAAAKAQFAVLDGAETDDYRWRWAGQDFAWITVGGVPVLLDASEMVALGDAFMDWEPSYIYAAGVIKALDPIPADYADDSRWP